jgi:hypothetical protein
MSYFNLWKRNDSLVQGLHIVKYERCITKCWMNASSTLQVYLIIVYYYHQFIGVFIMITYVFIFEFVYVA